MKRGWIVATIVFFALFCFTIWQSLALPQMDDLIARSSLLTVPPQLTEETCDRIIEIYQQSAAKLGLK